MDAGIGLVPAELGRCGENKSEKRQKKMPKHGKGTLVRPECF